MADTAKMEARVRELEARRAKGESVPELDALYTKMDNMNRKAHEDASKYVTGEMPNKPAVKKAKGGAIKKYDDGGAIKTMKDMVVQGAKKTGEDIHRIVGTEKGKALDKQAQEKERKGIDIEKLYDASRKRDEASRYKNGGSVSSASKRADGCAQRGKTKGRMI